MVLAGLWVGTMGFRVQLGVLTLSCPPSPPHPPPPDPEAPTDSCQPGPEQRPVIPRWVLARVTPVTLGSSPPRDPPR